MAQTARNTRFNQMREAEQAYWHERLLQSILSLAAAKEVRDYWEKDLVLAVLRGTEKSVEG